eukprot:TRINITY_DN1371_c0_g1_i1.p1 TRINITY_DN1371_c0_g1~~TRINITY_DN1371_c0_g1_i1.p1  ORF type:complete len:945 (-),score=141.29 TRINITY_DN1371_c0_g1_i1:106-2898(-)
MTTIRPSFLYLVVLWIFVSGQLDTCRVPFDPLFHSGVCSGLSDIALPNPGGPTQQLLFCCDSTPYDLVCYDSQLVCPGGGLNCDYAAFTSRTFFMDNTGDIVKTNGSLLLASVGGCELFYNGTRTGNLTINAHDFCVHYHNPSVPGGFPLADNVSYTMDRRRRIGQFRLACSSTLGNASTGVPWVNIAHLPGTARYATWSRALNPRVAPQPGVVESLSVVWDADTGDYVNTPMTVYGFCSGASHTLRGDLIVFGGDDVDPALSPWGTQWASWITRGINRVRLFHAGNETWDQTGEELPQGHWHPTVLTFPDGRVLNIGGWRTWLGPEADVVEVYDGNTVPPTQLRVARNISFVEQIRLLSFYPYVKLLHSAHDPARPTDHLVMLFACDYGQLVALTADNDLEARFELPEFPAPGVCSGWSAAGTAQMLAARETPGSAAGTGADGQDDGTGEWANEFVTFGGAATPVGATGGRPEVHPILRWFDPTGDPGYAENGCFCDVPAVADSYRLRFPDVTRLLRDGAMTPLPPGPDGRPPVLPNTTWEVERMPYPRVSGTSLTLPNGCILVVNGGKVGIGNMLTSEPITVPVLYNPYRPANQRYMPLARTNIPRTYHNVAVLTVAGEVLVGGSEEGPCYQKGVNGPACSENYRYEFRPEVYSPPYVYAADRPRITGVAGAPPVSSGVPGDAGIPGGSVEIGSVFDVEFEVSATQTLRFGPGGNVHISLVHPGAQTHGNEMSQKVVLCATARVSQRSDPAAPGGRTRAGRQMTRVKVRATTPAWWRRVMNPGVWMVFVVVGELDDVGGATVSSGSWLRFTAGSGDPPTPDTTTSSKKGLLGLLGLLGLVPIVCCGVCFVVVCMWRRQRTGPFAPVGVVAGKGPWLGAASELNAVPSLVPVGAPVSPMIMVPTDILRGPVTTAVVPDAAFPTFSSLVP